VSATGGGPEAAVAPIAAYALHESEERFRLLVEGVQDYAIFMLDPQGYIASWNPGAERAKGYTEDEIIGQHYSRFYMPEDVAAGKPKRMLEIARSYGRVEDEGWRVRKDGTRFWASVVITALRDKAGTLRGFAKVTRDLTERRQADEDRRARQTADEAVRLRNEFLSIAAHELKTPLTSLLGTAQVTLRRFQRDGAVEPARLVDVLRLIETQTKKMARLVEHLLDISRLEAGRLSPQRARTDLSALVSSVIEPIRVREPKHTIRARIPDRPVWAKVDPLRIEQVIINLVENALKYGAPDPAADGPVATAEVEIDLVDRDAAGMVTISVRDHGQGIAPEDRPRMFERFFRARAQAQQPGLGLGLYISREIVTLHGGAIRAEFPDDGGTRLVVELPEAA
jgi:PAS domain S-box-containing protein